jgi:serine/threonine protein kinase
VAVKVIDKKIFANHYNLKNIQSEIEIMKKIEHRNIVKLLDVYQTTNNMYIITEFCDEGDLMHCLKARKKIPEKEAVRLLKDIIDGFNYLSSLGITHRDLKPANILLKNGRCKIGDFGFAKNLQYGENTIMSSIVGTPLYMSPQILNRMGYTTKSDLWSIGLIYYEMLHGFTPWPANNEIQLINNIMSRQIAFDASVSEKSRDWIKAALKIKEEDRMSWEDAYNHPLFNEISRPDENKENAPLSTIPFERIERNRSISTTNRRDRSPNVTKERNSEMLTTNKTPRSKLDRIL